MDGCLLCLDINKELVDCIKVDSTEWQEHKIKSLIEKHLWVLESILPTSWLCNTCWQALQEFHKFYMRIEEAHIDFGKLMKRESKDDKETLTQEENAPFAETIELFESHLEPEILIDQLAIDDYKPIIKQELIDDLPVDETTPIQRNKRIRLSNDLTSDTEEINEDPLKNSKKVKSKTKNKKKEPSVPVLPPIESIFEKTKSEILHMKMDPDALQMPDTETKELDSSSDSEDHDDYDPTDDYDPQDNTVSTQKVENESDKSHSSDSENENEDSMVESDNKPLKGTRPPRKTVKIKQIKKSISDTEGSDVESDNKPVKAAKRSKKTANLKRAKKPPKEKKKVKTNTSNTDGSNAEENETKVPKITFKQRDQFLAEHFKMICAICQIQKPTFNALAKHFDAEHNERGYAVCCNKKFYHRGKLQEHVDIHVDPNLYKCEQCGKKLSTQKSLQSHQLVHLAEEEKKFPCHECGKSYAEERLLSIHNKRVHLRMFVRICDICGKRLRCGEAFQRHMMEHEGKPLPTITCPVCGIILATKHSLRKHTRHQHPEDGRREFICNICLKISPNVAALREHVRRVHSTEIHKCSMCERVFKMAIKLKEHMATHTGVALYTCPYCPKTFNASGGLHAHRKRQHPIEWEQQQIQKSYAEERLLSIHNKRVHLRMFVKICDMCGKRLRCGEAFQRHMMEHEGKPLPTITCPVCGIILATKHGLRKHTRHQHPEDGKREFICNICLKVSPNSAALQEHVRRVHSTEIHKCSMCERVFKMAIKLKEHMATHTGVALYTCPYCPKTFNASGGLHAHRKRQHPIEWEQQQIQKRLMRYRTPPPVVDTNNTITNFT